MKSFKYQARSASGRVIEGMISAASVNDAKLKLIDEEKLFVISLRRDLLSSFKRNNKLTDTSVLDWLEDTIAYLNAGLTIAESLKAYSSTTQESSVLSLTQDMLAAIHRGKALSIALVEFSKPVDSMLTLAFQTAEQTGDLSGALAAYRDHLKKRLALKRKITGLLAYPVFLFVSLFFILALMFVFVLPSFVNLFNDQGAQLPALTAFLIRLSDHFVYILGAVTISVIAVIAIWRSPNNQAAKIKRHLLKLLPVVSALHSILEQFRIANALHRLLNIGIPLAESLKHLALFEKDSVLQERIDTCLINVQQGQSLHATFQSLSLFEEKYLAMIKSAESVGNLPHVFELIAERLMEQFEVRLEISVRLLEPALIFTIGILVGTIVLGMYLPIFSISDVMY